MDSAGALSLAEGPQYEAGDPVPTAGIYELLNALGLPSGTQQILMQGERFPPAPRAWTWRRVAEMRPS